MFCKWFIILTNNYIKSCLSTKEYSCQLTPLPFFFSIKKQEPNNVSPCCRLREPPQFNDHVVHLLIDMFVPDNIKFYTPFYWQSKVSIFGVVLNQWRWMITGEEYQKYGMVYVRVFFMEMVERDNRRKLILVPMNKMVGETTYCGSCEGMARKTTYLGLYRENGQRNYSIDFSSKSSVIVCP